MAVRGICRLGTVIGKIACDPSLCRADGEVLVDKRGELFERAIRERRTAHGVAVAGDEARDRVTPLRVVQHDDLLPGVARDAEHVTPLEADAVSRAGRLCDENDAR